ncbi:hypothetical protein FJZ31_32630 [Candidatus Poribacteria bacterium]|nr:hypothetical protein [Candidatus Poribacteria bacterium]
MAAGTNTLETVRRKVISTLRRGLKAHGVNPKIHAESAVNGTKWRFSVISEDFAPWLHSERQDVIWRILRESLSAEELLKVTIVLALTKKEAVGDFS